MLRFFFRLLRFFVMHIADTSSSSSVASSFPVSSNYSHFQGAFTAYQNNPPSNITETRPNFTCLKSRSQELKTQNGLTATTSLETGSVSRRIRLKSWDIERNGLTLISSLPCGEMNKLFGHALLERGSGYNIMGKIGEAHTEGISLWEEREKQRVKMRMEEKDNLKLEYRVFSAWVTYVQLKKLKQKHQVVAQAFYYRKILLRFYKLLKLTYTTQRSLQQCGHYHHNTAMEMAILRFKLRRERILVGIVFSAWVKYTNIVCREKAALRLKCDKFRRKTVLAKYLYVWRKRKDAKIILQEIALNHFRLRWQQLSRKSLLQKSMHNWRLFVCEERKKRHLFVVKQEFQREKARKYFTTWLQLYRAKHYQKSIMAEQFYANSYLPAQNKISLQLSFGAWKKYWKNRLEKRRLSIIANSFFKRRILHKFVRIWLNTYIEETERKLLIATQFHLVRAQCAQLRLKSVCFGALLRYKNKSTYTKLLFRSAQNFSTRRILSSTYQIWKQKWLLRTTENEQTCLSLWHWSSALKRKVFIGWREAARKGREDRIKFSASVLATRDNLQKQYINRGILHQKSVLCKPGNNFLTGCNSKFTNNPSIVEKYAFIWLQKYRRNKFYKKLNEEKDGCENVLDILERSDELSYASTVLNNIESSSSAAPLPGILLDYIKEKSLTDYHFESQAVRKGSKFNQLSTQHRYSKGERNERDFVTRKQSELSSQREKVMSNNDLNLQCSNASTSDCEPQNKRLERLDERFSEPDRTFGAGESESSESLNNLRAVSYNCDTEKIPECFVQENKTECEEEMNHPEEFSGNANLFFDPANPNDNDQISQLDDTQKTFSVPNESDRTNARVDLESNKYSEQVVKTPIQSHHSDQSNLQQQGPKIWDPIPENNIYKNFVDGDLGDVETQVSKSSKPRIPDFMRESIEGMGLVPMSNAFGYQPEVSSIQSNSESVDNLSASVEETLASKLAREILDLSKTMRIPRNLEEEFRDNSQNIFERNPNVGYPTYEVSRNESKNFETAGQIHDSEQISLTCDDLDAKLGEILNLKSSVAIDPNQLMKPDDFTSSTLASSTPNNSGSLENNINNVGLVKQTELLFGADPISRGVDCSSQGQDYNEISNCDNHNNSIFDVDNINVSDLADVTLYANELSTSIIQDASDEVDRLNKSFSDQNAAQNYDSKLTSEISTQTDLSLLEATNIEPKLGPNARLLSQQPLCAKCGDLCNYQDENQNCDSNNYDEMTGHLSDSNQAQQTNVSSKLNQSQYSIELKRMVVKYKSLKAKSEKKRNDLKQLVADITAGQKSLDESQTGRIIELKSEIKSVNKQLKELKNSIKTYDQDRN